jgi:phosphohistidine phosphatase
MEIYLMRHGIALSGESTDAPSDEQRPLTPKGVKRTRKAAKGLMAVRPSIDRLLTSSLVRARQTADIVADALRLKGQVEELTELAPGGDPEKLVGGLSDYQECQGILLVGHQPGLGEIASLLLSGQTNLEINLKKSAVCCIEVVTFPAAGHGSLNWMLAPKQLRKLAKG